MFLNSQFYKFDNWKHLFDPKIREFLSDPALILDVVREKSEAGYRFHIFCPFYVERKAIEAAFAFIDQSKNPCDASYSDFCRGTRIIVDCPDDLLTLVIAGEEQVLTSSDIETDAFRGKNSAILITNGESKTQINDWLGYYQKQHGLEAVVIYERVQPEGETLELSGDGLLCRHVQVTAALGKMEPSAREVYMAPDAPGKERMDVPGNDLWRSELNDNMLLEIARLRYLNQARAVLNVQPSDIIPPSEPNIFDKAVQSEIGYVQLFGNRCFPWRVRKNQDASFGDHCTVLFERKDANKAWCVDPNGARNGDVWNLYRVGKIADDPKFVTQYWRMTGLRHEDPNDPNPTLAPKTGLILDKSLKKLVKKHFDGNPVLPPEKEEVETSKASKSGRRLIVTTMKNEGPFLLEWIAYHKAIGFDDFVVFTNDCSDGTDKFFDLLHAKGIVEHRDNPYVKLDMKPQHAALADVQKSKIFKKADWVICMDVDEYINIHVGDGTLDALFKAVGDANMISMTWRLIGNSDVVDFVDQPIIEQFHKAAHDVTRFPHQAWGVKTLYRQLGLFKKMGVHRPKGLKPELMDNIHWVNGSGRQLPETFYRTAWRTGTATVGYDMVTLNHYAVRSMESFLVKRDRGRVNHVDRDQGLHYWFRMNHNVIEDNSIKRMIPKMREELDKLMADPEIAAFHNACVAAHRAKIDELLETDAYQDFFALINSDRLRELSTYTNKFGMNIFEMGPDVIPDEAIDNLRGDKIQYFNVNSDGKPFD